MDAHVRQILEKQHYKVVGQNGAVKLCHWTREQLLHDRGCYKADFYGIASHRCMQMTPVADHCNVKCLFCWRSHTLDSYAAHERDPPVDLLEGALQAQQEIVSGFKGDARCDIGEWLEARQPRHVAISLAGEPTLYPHLGEFIAECHRRGITTFLVTNGTLPAVLERLDPLPTQLYVTVAAPNEEIYQRVVVPKTRQEWKNLQRTLELLPSLDTRTVIRHTLVQGLNLGWEEEYAALDAIAEPWFIEPKGYVNVGESKQRLTMDHMPSHEAVRGFARRLAGHLGLEILAEREDSRVVLIGDPARPRFVTAPGPLT